MTKQIIPVSFIVAIALSTANCGITELHASSKGTSTQVAIPGLSKQVVPAYQNDTKTAAWFEQGGVRFYSEWKAGKGDGVWIYFHENGEISERAQVLDDIWHGVAEGWYANGNKAFESTFVHGKRVVHQKFENQPKATP